MSVNVVVVGLIGVGKIMMLVKFVVEFYVY